MREPECVRIRECMCASCACQENWNKWQGYSFYTGEQAVEKCLTVKFALNIQPVVSVILGLSFELLPEDLFEVITTVCWPNQFPGGLDLSVLRSEIKTANHLLFSRTLRLAKRFGSHTDFAKENLGTGYQTWRSPLGIAKGESGTAIEAMSLVDSNRSEAEGGGAKTESWYWRTEPEEVYLASIDYGDSMEPNRTWEVRGEDAMLRLSRNAGGSQAGPGGSHRALQLAGEFGKVELPHPRPPRRQRRGDGCPDGFRTLPKPESESSFG